MNLNDINPANAMEFSKLIQRNEELKAIRQFLAIVADFDWEAFLEANGNILGSRGRSDRIIGTCNSQQPSVCCIKNCKSTHRVHMSSGGG